MTKEDLYDELNNRETEHGVDSQDIQELLNEFFSSNVCTHKGESRHPYAEVIHAMAEGYTIQVLDEVNGYVWKDDTCPTFTKKCQYRIKPPEPVYEWQYMYKNLLTNQYDITGYLSDDEYIESNNSWHKLEETKRARQ